MLTPELRVRVYWPEEGRFFRGKVCSSQLPADGSHAVISFDDGETLRVDLREQVCALQRAEAALHLLTIWLTCGLFLSGGAGRGGI